MSFPNLWNIANKICSSIIRIRHLCLIAQQKNIGVCILDKILDNLKTQLPFLNKGKKNSNRVSTDDEYEDVIHDDFDEGDKTSSDIKVEKIKSRSLPDDIDESSDESKSLFKNPKVRKLALPILAFIAIALILSDEFIDQPTSSPEVSVSNKKNTPSASEPELAPQEAQPEPVMDASTAEPEVEASSPEPVMDASTPEPVMDTSTPEPVMDASTPEPAVDGSLDDANIGEMNDPATGDSTTVTTDVLEELEKKINKQKELEEEVTEYVSPPDYEYRGRGLVYNCLGKHWACIDGPSYKQCQKNFKFNHQNSKKVECYPANVFTDLRGCKTTQLRNVSSNSSTDFCK